MLLDITNTCRMGCPHCMQRSTPEPQHMSDETFGLAMRFAGMARPRAVLMSGGEPTEHPKWLEYARAVVEGGYSLVIATNGMWIGTGDEDGMVGLMRESGDAIIQITTVKGLYPRHEETSAKVAALKDRFKREGLRHRICVADRITGMIGLGRCCDSPELSAAARENTLSTTSCFPSALVAAQTDLHAAIRILEERGKICHPLVDWTGGLHWSESWLCPAFASVRDDFGEICRKAREWRPCGKCEDYRKLLDRNDGNYAMGKALLGIRMGV